MKIGILQCGYVNEKFLSRFGDYPQMIITFFAQAAPDVEFKILRVQDGEYPENIDEYDAYISTGSRHGVYEDLPWIPTLEAFIRELNQAKKKYIGICFGHQLMVKALGGDVQKSDKGWGIGITEHALMTTKPWMEPEKTLLNLLASHQDQVIALPQDVQIEVLAGSAFCPYYLLSHGDHFLSIQGHPEFKKEYSAALIDFRRDIIPTDRVEQGMHSLTKTPDDQVFLRWMINFLNS